MVVIILFLALVVILLSVSIAGWSSAPFVPTRKEDLPRILKLANLKEGQTFFDLGCGNARVVKYIAQNSKAKAIGVEMAIPIYVWAKVKQLFSGLKNLKIKYNSFFKVDLSEADVVYIFGYPKTLNKKVIEKLEKDLKPGAKVLSYVFEIQGWQPVLIDKPQENAQKIFVYKK